MEARSASFQQFLDCAMRDLNPVTPCASWTKRVFTGVLGCSQNGENRPIWVIKCAWEFAGACGRWLPVWLPESRCAAESPISATPWCECRTNLRSLVSLHRLQWPRRRFWMKACPVIDQRSGAVSITLTRSPKSASAQERSQPPSTSTVVPVTKSFSMTKRIAWATSSAVPIRGMRLLAVTLANA